MGRGEGFWDWATDSKPINLHVPEKNETSERHSVEVSTDF